MVTVRLGNKDLRPEKNMLKQKIAIIGVGNMGGAIAQCLLNKKVVTPKQLFLSNKYARALSHFKIRGCAIFTDNAKAVSIADVIILAVKPQIIKEVLEEIKPVVHQRQLIISIATGTHIKTIKQCLSQNQPVIRAMPNLCATVGASVSAWIKSREISHAHIHITKSIFSAIGIEIEVKKEMFLDAVTAVSGCGPAYVFYLTQLLEEGAVQLGIPKKIASRISRQTLIGSAMLLKQSSKTPNQLRRAVTSKGGATEAAFKKFRRKRFKQGFFAGVAAAYQKAQKLNT
jgi:pyrroline-5-carboxylate reductase